MNEDKYCPPIINPSDPNTIPKFVDHLQIPEVATPIIPSRGSENKDFYYITMEEVYHKFHCCFPETKVWGYDGMYPGPTIEVFKNNPIQVQWANCLPCKHILPVDTTLHGVAHNPQVRTVVHLHGANVKPDSDGNPDAWFTKNYSVTGHAFTREVYEYPNNQPSTTLWYHDHAISLTRLNVYAGLAGLYIIRDSIESKLNLPKGKYEIPLIIQDKSFNEDGSLFYPAGPEPDPKAPAVTVYPSIIPGFAGNTILVNGKVWPYLNVEPRKYRFKILNASNTSAYTLNLSNEDTFYQIGTDGGLLDFTKKLKSFILEPAERIDLIIDFSKSKGKEIILLNSDSNADENTSMVMKFKVEKTLKSLDNSCIPNILDPNKRINQNLASKIRPLVLTRHTDEYNRPMFLLNNKMWTDPVTEIVQLNSIEMWDIINPFTRAHPIHVHLVQFKIVCRTPFDVPYYEETGKIKFTGNPEEPLDFERGFKDTVRVEPGKITRIIMQFKDYPGDFVWHCHILEHEDYDMMRPLRVLE
ncbi:multicopper oxidase family protein [Clostridium paraputrificum]|uniref:multicopper oxidase family protein n=1 Tax=Clostridium paraputrificum TaxID=29363 RepID=UPI003D32534C